MRIRELEQLKNETKQKLDALVATSEQMEEYEEEIEIEEEEEEEQQHTTNDDDDAEAITTETNTTPPNQTENDNQNETETNTKSEEEEAESKQQSEETKQIKKTQKIIKKRKKQLSESQTELLKELSLSLQSYSTEISIMTDETKKHYSIDKYEDYAIDDYTFCGAKNEKSRTESWFRVQNVNYWGKIGGFDTMLTRISHAKCAVAVSDLVNLIRPVAQVRSCARVNMRFVSEHCIHTT